MKLRRRGRDGIKKQSGIGAGENKKPQPLHARARDVKASGEAGVSPAEPVAAEPTRLPLKSIADEHHRRSAIALVARRQALRADLMSRPPIGDYLRSESGALPDGLRVHNFRADKVWNGW